MSFALHSINTVEMPGDRGFGISLKLAPGNDFLDFTMQHVGKPLAVMIDDEPAIILMLRSSIADQVLLAGDWTEAEAKDLAAKLDAQRGKARERVLVRGSETTATGKPTIELAVVLREGEEFYDNPWMTEELNGKELRFGPGVSFEVAAAFPTQDRHGRIAIGFKVADVEGYRAFTEKAAGRGVGFFSSGKLFCAPELEGALPGGSGVLTSGSAGFSADEATRLIKHLRGTTDD
jgi:preprotein translocase subunit SecD